MKTHSSSPEGWLRNRVLPRLVQACSWPPLLVQRDCCTYGVLQAVRSRDAAGRNFLGGVAGSLPGVGARSVLEVAATA
eukprot:7164818-Alexandrium_andersonii.AAC.1